MINRRTGKVYRRAMVFDTQNKLKHLLHLRRPPDYEGVRRSLARWQPFGVLIYFHLLLDGLSKEGYLK